MHCALGSSNEVDNVTDTLVTAGTSVTIRNLSGEVVVQTTIETNQERTVLADHIKQEYAKNAYIPQMCVRLEWAQPVGIQTPVGFELGQSVMHMEATLIVTAIPADFDPGDGYYVPNTCLACYEPALDVDDLDIDRNTNCVRCCPCAICDRCKVVIAEQPICLLCVEPSEMELLSDKHRRRCSLIQC